MKLIASKCGTNETKFIESFDELFGIKNETLSALEQNYCYAVTTNGNDLLPLRNVNLNPKNIATTRLNCDSIIRNEREDQRDFLRRFLRQYSRGSALETFWNTLSYRKKPKKI